MNKKTVLRLIDIITGPDVELACSNCDLTFSSWRTPESTKDLLRDLMEEHITKVHPNA